MRCILPPYAPEHVCDIRRRTVLVANPAAGADWSVQAPNSEAWDIQRLSAVFTASAVVATRTIRLEVFETVNRIASYQPSQTAVANAVARCVLVPGGPQGANTQGSGVSWGGPDPFILPPMYSLLVSTSGIDAGDQWTLVALDVIFELNRGRGAAKRYAAWVQSQEAALPADRLAVDDIYRG